MNRNLWLGRLALMSLCLVFAACTELSPSGEGQYVVQAPGSVCAPGDVNSFNACAPPMGCLHDEQWCDPATNRWTGCGMIDRCIDSGVVGGDGGTSCTDGTYRYCTAADGTLGTSDCIGGTFGPCHDTPYDGGVSDAGPDPTCGGDVRITDPAMRSCSNGRGACARTGMWQCDSATGVVSCDAVAGLPATETCDSIDNDCDGAIDTFTETCYTGPTGTATVGICRYGTRSCSAGVYGACSGDITPQAEVMDDGIDQDCNGADMSAQPCGGATVGGACTVGIGACQRTGAYFCDAAGHLACDAPAGPASTETCDNLDNDCDGTIDDNLVRTCYTGTPGTAGVTPCMLGIQVCNAGVWPVACSGEIVDQLEIPDDGIDQDCNGEDLASVSCGGDRTIGDPCGPVGRGTCAASGILECVGGILRCSAVPTAPVSETCDNLDNDCDGFIDDALVRSCYSGAPGTAGVRPCMAGQSLCSSGTWSACSGEVLPTAETCGDGLDQDCSGADLSCGPCGLDPLLGTSCSVGIGACRRTGGSYICDAAGHLACSVAAGAISPETCNNVDDNCNGTTDEGVTQFCYTGSPATAGVGECHVGTATCMTGTFGPCAGERTPTAEICGNGHDENCDGFDPACPVADAGVPMTDAGTDAGMPASDAGTDSGPVGTDAGSGMGLCSTPPTEFYSITPPAAVRAMCSSGAITIRAWGNCPTDEFLTAGPTLTFGVRASGRVWWNIYCSGAPWGASWGWDGSSVRHISDAGFTPASVTVNGVDRTANSRICQHPGGGGSFWHMPVTAADPSLIDTCPPPGSF